MPGGGLETAAGQRQCLALGAAVPASAMTAASRDAPAQADAERRQLTVMFCDLVGPIALAARPDPEDLHEVIAAYHRAVTKSSPGSMVSSPSTWAIGSGLLRLPASA